MRVKCLPLLIFKQEKRSNRIKRETKILDARVCVCVRTERKSMKKKTRREDFEGGLCLLRN